MMCLHVCMKPLYGVERLHKNSFKSKRVFEKIKIFGLILVMFLRSQSYDFDVFALIGV